MGANQSMSDQQANTRGITVVHSSPSQDSTEETINLPAKVPPVLSLIGYEIDSNRHKPEVQLNYKAWVNFVTVMKNYANSRADLIATRQSQLQEKIISLDNYLQRFTDSYITGEHKALARLNDDCKQIDELSKQLDKYTIQSELCLDMLNKLNFLLPEEQKLEPLER